MKLIIDLLPSVVKGVLAVCAFLIGLGWASYQAISSMVEHEVAVAKEDLKEIRAIDMEHINGRFDKLETLIKQSR
jgi:hypothetical protein